MADASVADLLQTLHPMREPPPIAPIAPYVQMLLVGLVAAALGFVLLRRIAQRRAGLRDAAEAALAASRRLPAPERLAAQAQMLRRLVRVRSGEAAARTDGAAWLATLDRTFATTFFTHGAGRAFADGLYRRDPGADLDAIERGLAELLARMPAQIEPQAHSNQVRSNQVRSKQARSKVEA